MLAVHLENLLFLLLLVVAGLFQLLGKAVRKASTDEKKRTSEPPPRTPKPIQRAPVESDEQRVRKFLEALGQPPASRPPPPVTQRPTYRKPLVLPHVPPLGSPLPPLVTRPPDLPSEFEVHRESIPIPAEQPRAAQRSTEPVFQVHESAPPSAPCRDYARSQNTTASCCTAPCNCYRDLAPIKIESARRDRYSRNSRATARFANANGFRRRDFVIQRFNALTLQHFNVPDNVFNNFCKVLWNGGDQNSF